MEIQGYRKTFDPPLESKYECSKCFLALRDPVQSFCGHRFCKECIRHLLRDADPKCPVDNEPLHANQLFPDIVAKREMMELHVFCRMKNKFGCTWKGALKDLEDHVSQCPFVEVSCPTGCGGRIQRQWAQVHMERGCTNRRVLVMESGATDTAGDVQGPRSVHLNPELAANRLLSVEQKYQDLQQKYHDMELKYRDMEQSLGQIRGLLYQHLEIDTCHEHVIPHVIPHEPDQEQNE